MIAEPVYCRHGRATSWRIVDLMPGDRLPVIERCVECWPDLVLLDDPCWNPE